jgi:hypothetical protein
MNQLVKILSSDGGERRENPVWCLWNTFDGSPRTVCGGEAFGKGESHCEFEMKEDERGITCPKCKEITRFFKAVKL